MSFSLSFLHVAHYALFLSPRRLFVPLLDLAVVQALVVVVVVAVTAARVSSGAPTAFHRPLSLFSTQSPIVSLAGLRSLSRSRPSFTDSRVIAIAAVQSSKASDVQVSCVLHGAQCFIASLRGTLSPGLSYHW